MPYHPPPLSQGGGIDGVIFTPLEGPAARSGDDACSFFSEHGV
jgi:hypothetical protein